MEVMTHFAALFVPAAVVLLWKYRRTILPMFFDSEDEHAEYQYTKKFQPNPETLDT